MEKHAKHRLPSIHSFRCWLYQISRFLSVVLAVVKIHTLELMWSLKSTATLLISILTADQTLDITPKDSRNSMLPIFAVMQDEVFICLRRFSWLYLIEITFSFKKKLHVMSHKKNEILLTSVKASILPFSAIFHRTCFARCKITCWEYPLKANQWITFDQIWCNAWEYSSCTQT